MIRRIKNKVRNKIRKVGRDVWVKACIKRRSTGQKLYSDKKFCVIYRWADNTGIFSHIVTYLPALYWAEEQGMIPVFDTRDVPNVHKPKDVQNWYELFFEPPAGYSMEDVSNAKNYIVVDAEKLYNSVTVKADNAMQFFKNRELLDQLRNVYGKYIRLNERTKAHIDLVWEQLTGKCESGRFLGVRCRGTGYNIVCSEGLSAATSVDIIALVKQALKEGMDKIFLATDDEDIISSFKESFDGDMLFFLEEEDRISTSDVEKEIEHGVGIWRAQVEAMKERTNNLYMHNLNYITEIMLLTKCEGIISNKCSAGLCLPLMKQDWKYEFYF